MKVEGANVFSWPKNVFFCRTKKEIISRIIQFDQVGGWNGRKPFIVLDEPTLCLPENGQLHLRSYVKMVRVREQSEDRVHQNSGAPTFLDAHCQKQCASLEVKFEGEKKRQKMKSCPRYRFLNLSAMDISSSDY